MFYINTVNVVNNFSSDRRSIEYSMDVRFSVIFFL